MAGFAFWSRLRAAATGEFGRVPTSDEYRAKALDCLEQARRAVHPAVRDELTNLAACYVRLCLLAEQNATTDLVDATSPELGAVRRKLRIIK
jgi:hypothetical protein